MTALIALAAALAPLITVAQTADRAVDRGRDVWLYAVAWLGVVVLVAHAPALALIWVAVLLHWRSPEETWAVLTWAGIAATWCLVQTVPAAWLPVVPMGWRLLALAQVALASWQWWQGTHHRPQGTMAHHSVLAAYLALVWPFSSPWEWPAYALGLLLTCSWLAFVAVAAGILVISPTWWPWIALALGVFLLLESPWVRPYLINRTTRGGSLDSLRQRWRTWGTVLRRMRRWPIWLIGAGPERRAEATGLRFDLAREITASNRALLTWSCHCEPLQLAYTYGLPAVAALGLLVWQVGTRLRVGDPWSAAVVAGAVVACASIPCRVAPVGLTWLIALAVVGGRP